MNVSKYLGVFFIKILCIVGEALDVVRATFSWNILPKGSLEQFDESIVVVVDSRSIMHESRSSVNSSSQPSSD